MLVAVAKTGNIGTSTVLEYLFDERADRKDLDVRVVTSGAKMSGSASQNVIKKVLDIGSDLILYSTPNASAPGPKKVIDALEGRNCIVISDAPALKARDFIEEKGLGYILIKADAMIGARREFLDPTEMALFNSDMLKVLAGTGALRLVQVEVGKAIDAIKKGESYLPRIVVTAKSVAEYGNFKNPYALVKAQAAYRLGEVVGELNVKGCFMVKDQAEYIQTVASAHEIMRSAASLVDEAREIEKSGDSVYRSPFSPDGKVLSKTGLMDKPK